MKQSVLWQPPALLHGELQCWLTCPLSFLCGLQPQFSSCVHLWGFISDLLCWVLPLWSSFPLIILSWGLSPCLSLGLFMTSKLVALMLSHVLSDLYKLPFVPWIFLQILSIILTFIFWGLCPHPKSFTLPACNLVFSCGLYFVSGWQYLCSCSVVSLTVRLVLH